MKHIVVIGDGKAGDRQHEGRELHPDRQMHQCAGTVMASDARHRAGERDITGEQREPAASLAWVCVKYYGLNGAGIAFFASYVFHGFLTYPIVRHLSGFCWSAENRRIGLLFLCLIGVVFGGFYVLPLLWASGIGIVTAVVSGVYSIRELARLVSLEQIPRPIRRLIVGLGLVCSTP